MFRGKEVSLESSKGLCKGSRSNLNHGAKDFKDPHPKSMKIHKNTRKSMAVKIVENQEMR